jgi:plasmid stability protein
MDMTLTINLPDEQTAVLEARAEAQGLSAEEYVRQMVEHELRSERPAAGEKPLHPAAQIILDCMGRVAPEELAAMPIDGASQHDHYIYGWPKTEE